MKRKITSSSPENLTPVKFTGIPMRRKKRTCSYLPIECWEIVLRFLNNDSCCMNSLSLVSRQFLSITNRIRVSVTIKYETLPFLRYLFKRFTNLTSLDLSHCHDQLSDLLRKISKFPLKLSSLKLPDQHIFPANGLQDFSQTITTLTSLTCCSHFFSSNDLLLIADCFPLLKQLNLSRPQFENYTNGIHDNHINGIRSLLSNSPCIQHLDLNRTYLLNDQHIAELSLLLADLVSINLTGCWRLTESALFSLVTNCPSLSDIKIECNTIGKENIGGNSSNSFTVVSSTKLKSLSLTRCQILRDENMILFSSIFPNLEVLDLSYWKDISEEIICQVLRCCKIKHLNFSYTNFDDKSLYMISKNCSGLLQLLLENCRNVTVMGMKHVVENCTQLREINLRYCDKLHANAVALMVSSRPSLRKIIAPFDSYFSARERKVFLRRGCLVC